MRAGNAAAGGQLAVGTAIPARELTAVDGRSVALPDPRGLVHLQLRRFAGCPVCNLHLRSFVARHGDLTAAGISEVAVFHATDEDLRPHISGLPFPVIGDPDKRLYAEFGVESRKRALLDPRAWPTILKAIATSLMGLLRGRDKPPRLVPRGGRFGLPADFLIAADGRLVACKYGEHVGDHWSVAEVLALARTPSVRRSPSP